MYNPKNLTNYISQLRVGEHYKGYSALCTLFNEEKQQGNSKITQLKHWSSYFSYTKLSAHDWVVDIIYEEKHPILRATKYQHLSTALWSYLLSAINTTGEVTIAKRIIYNYMGMPYPTNTLPLKTKDWSILETYLNAMTKVRYRLIYSGLPVQKVNNYKILCDHNHCRLGTLEEVGMLKDIKYAIRQEYRKRKETTLFNSDFYTEYKKRCVDVLGYYGISAVTLNVESLPTPLLDKDTARRDFIQQMRASLKTSLIENMSENDIDFLNDIYFPLDAEIDEHYTIKNNRFII